MMRRIAVVLIVLAGLAAGAAIAMSRPGHAATLGRFPLAIAVDQRDDRAFVANYWDGSISVLGAHGTRLLRTVPVPGSPSALGLDELAGRLLVAGVDPAGRAGTVSLLDTADGAIIHATAVGIAPAAIAVDERLHRALVLNLDSSTVSLLDTRSGRLLRTTAVRLVGRSWAETPICRGLQATLTCYSNATVERLSMLQLGRAARSARQSPQGLVADPARGRALLVATYRDSVLVLSTRSGALLRTIQVGAAPCALALDPASGHAIVTNLDGNTVSVIDPATGAVLRTVRVGHAPGVVALDARTGHAFVANFGDGTISVLDIRTGQILSAVAVGMGPTAIAIDGRRGQVVVSAISGSAASAPFPTEPGSATVLDARSGAVLRSVAVDDDPNAIAVDERAGRAYVVSALVRIPPASRPPSGWDAWRRRWLPFLTPAAPDPTHGTVRVIDTTGR